jgi:hypothetical protein
MLIKGKFIYSPMIRVYEGVDIFSFLFYFNKKKMKNKYIKYYIYINKLYFFLFLYNLNFYVKNYIFFISTSIYIEKINLNLYIFKCLLKKNMN